jgi:hypothetical protein
MNHLQADSFERKERRAFVLLLQGALIFCTVLTILSCQGSQGATGATGPQGPAGAPGPSAQTATFTIAVTDWRAFGAGTNVALIESGWRTAPNITQSIMNSGAVLVYMQWESNPATWQQLPITYYFTDFFRVIDAQFRLGQIKFFINQSNTTPPALPDGPLIFRVVAITGTTTTTALSTQMDITSYQAVKQAFHLTD